MPGFLVSHIGLSMEFDRSAQGSRLFFHYFFHPFYRKKLSLLLCLCEISSKIDTSTFVFFPGLFYHLLGLVFFVDIEASWSFYRIADSGD